MRWRQLSPSSPSCVVRRPSSSTVRSPEAGRATMSFEDAVVVGGLADVGETGVERVHIFA